MNISIWKQSLAGPVHAPHHMVQDRVEGRTSWKDEVRTEREQKESTETNIARAKQHQIQKYPKDFLLRLLQPILRLIRINPHGNPLQVRLSSCPAQTIGSSRRPIMSEQVVPNLYPHARVHIVEHPVRIQNWNLHELPGFVLLRALILHRHCDEGGILGRASGSDYEGQRVVRQTINQNQLRVQREAHPSMKISRCIPAAFEAGKLLRQGGAAATRFLPCRF